MIPLPDGFGLTFGASAVALAIAGLLAAPFALALPTRLRDGSATWAPVFGMVLFLAGIWLVQAPLQAGLQAWVSTAVSPFWLGAHVWALPVALALVAALVQELCRLGAVLGALRLRPGAPVAVGALAGAGVGLIEAAMVLGTVPSSALHLVSVAVLERVGAVAFHTGAGAVLGWGLDRHRLWRALAVVLVVHAVIDSLAAAYGVGLVPLFVVEGVSLVLGLATWGAGLARARATRSVSASGAAGPGAWVR